MYSHIFKRRRKKEKGKGNLVMFENAEKRREGGREREITKHLKLNRIK